jgi:hypothetical protein
VHSARLEPARSLAPDSIAPIAPIAPIWKVPSAGLAARRSLSTTNRGQLSCADEKVRGEQLKRKARARRRRRREGAVRAAWCTRSVRRSELVRVAQLVLVLEVVDSVRARQVGGNVDALAKPVAVGRRQSEVNNAVLARQTRRQRAGSGRQRAGRAGAPVMPPAARPLLEYSERRFRRLPR